MIALEASGEAPRGTSRIYLPRRSTSKASAEFLINAVIDCSDDMQGVTPITPSAPIITINSAKRILSRIRPSHDRGSSIKQYNTRMLSALKDAEEEFPFPAVTVGYAKDHFASFGNGILVEALLLTRPSSGYTIEQERRKVVDKIAEGRRCGLKPWKPTLELAWADDEDTANDLSDRLNSKIFGAEINLGQFELVPHDDFSSREDRLAYQSEVNAVASK